MRLKIHLGSKHLLLSFSLTLWVLALVTISNLLSPLSLLHTLSLPSDSLSSSLSSSQSEEFNITWTSKISYQYITSCAILAVIEKPVWILPPTSTPIPNVQLIYYMRLHWFLTMNINVCLMARPSTIKLLLGDMMSCNSFRLTFLMSIFIKILHSRITITSRKLMIN